MTARSLALFFACILPLAPRPAHAEDLCKGKTPGSITFFSEEISRDKPLPAPATTLTVGKPMFALACLTDTVGPQKEGGTKFRTVLYVKATKTEKYSSFAGGKQLGVLRPELSKPRKEIIIAINEDFDHLEDRLDPGEYEFRLQSASEKGTGKLDVTIDLKNEVAYIQELRKAGYLADGKVKVVLAPK